MTRLILWKDGTYSLVSPSQLTLLSKEDIEVINRVSNDGAPGPRDLIMSLPKPKKRKRKRQKAKSVHQWKRMSLRNHEQEIVEAKMEYKHTNDYVSCEKSQKALRVADTLPRLGLSTKMFPTCIPKKQSDDLGYGLVALETIPKGSEIGEYVGEFRTSLPKDHSYVMDFEKEQMKVYVDGRVYGNYMRFVNHSCDPNATVHVSEYDNFERAMIVALRDIKEGDFITFKYKQTPENCKCSNCVNT